MKQAGLQVRLEKEIAEKFKKHAEALGKSRSEILREYVIKSIEKDKNNGLPVVFNEDKKITKNLVFSLNEEEAIRFNNYAENIGETRSRLLRKLVRELINNPAPDLLHDEQSMIRFAIRHLAGISRNLNQVTAAINGGKLTHKSVDNAYLDSIINAINNFKSEFTRYLDITRKRLVLTNKENK
jgi:predicted DNA-binding protein